MRWKDLRREVDDHQPRDPITTRDFRSCGVDFFTK